MIQVRAISRSMWVGIRNNSMLTWLDKDLASLPPHSCLNWKDICFVFLILKSRSLKGKLGRDCSVRNKHCKMRNVLISRACCFSSHSSHSFLEAGLQVPTKAVACYAGDSLSGGLGLRVSHFQTQTLPFYSQLSFSFLHICTLCKLITLTLTLTPRPMKTLIFMSIPLALWPTTIVLQLGLEPSFWTQWVQKCITQLKTESPFSRIYT